MPFECVLLNPSAVMNCNGPVLILVCLLCPVVEVTHRLLSLFSQMFLFLFGVHAIKALLLHLSPNGHPSLNSKNFSNANIFLDFLSYQESL